ncbi:synaptogenesis protein syg-2-like [Haliotis rubra]|uniref:synaptogenesis protein syg-2-like n=1 Tax=Haliotis rubra TaxID=36100 RepID=UPI001EE5EBBC|nr:synaptogenesis protein syg-2-like [Haliotis rubra]
MCRRVFLELIPLLILLDTARIRPCESAPVLATNRRVPVEGVSFSITCTLDAAIIGTTRFYKGATQGGCSSSGRCGTSVSGYNVSLDSTSRILTLDIASADSTRDSGTWTCSDGATSSNNITLSQFAAVLDWSSVTFSPQLTSLPSSVTPQNTISVTVTTPCAAPAAVITWRYQQGVSGVPPSSISSTQGSCPSGQVQTTNTLSLPGNTVSLYNRQVSLTVSVEHDSFDPPTYTKSVTSTTIQFPVPVTSVTLTNISSDNEKIGLVTGQSLTLTCVTSASFPTSTVTWESLPSGTSPTVSTETTSGVMVKTTSSVTFTVSRSDQGRSFRCQAENINGQTSPQSNRVTLEVWYPPDKPNTTNPGTLCQGKSTSLTCSSSPDHGNPPVTFYWTKNSIAVHTGSSYTFSPVKADNGADIRCAAGNTYTDRAGSPRPQSDARQLSVYYVGAPSITPAATQTRKEGESLSLTCSVDGNPDNAAISWTFNGSPIPGSSVMKADLNRSDDGEYSCTGRVNTGSVCPGGSLQGRSTVKVIVNYPASISMMTGNSRSGSVAVNESDPVIFGCELDNAGNPRSVIRLLNGSEELTRADNSLTATYRLESADCRQRGNYTCTAPNNVGAPVTQRVELLVKCSPRVDGTVFLPLKYATRLDGDVTVSVAILAYPLPSFTWSRSISTSQDLTGSSSPVSDISVTARLHLTNLQEQDFGDYSLTVDNGVGESVTYTVNIVPSGPPNTPTQFRDLLNATSSSVWLS